MDLPPGSGPVLIWGAPGTGKSTVLIEAAVKRMEHHGVDPAGALLLAPSRLAAARLRDGFSARLSRSLSTSPARTWSSYAFDLLRRAKVEGRMPHLDGPPRLMSGPEQDLIIRDLLAGHRMGLGTDPQWPAELADALDTRGFRQEIRQLFDRVIEYGLAPEELAELGAGQPAPGLGCRGVALPASTGTWWIGASPAPLTPPASSRPPQPCCSWTRSFWPRNATGWP